MASCSCLVFLLIRSELRRYPGCHHCNVDDQREAGEDKRKQEKSETQAIRESITSAVSATVNGGARAISSTIVWGRVITASRICWFFSFAIAFCALLLGRVPYGAVVGSFAGANRYQRYYPESRAVANGARHRIYCHRNKRHFPRFCSTKLPPVDLLYMPYKGRLVHSQ